MKIQNLDALAVTPERKQLLTIAEAGLAAIDTKEVIKELIGIDGNFLKIGSEKIDLSQTGKLVFIGVGKCAADAAAAVEGILGDRIARGVAVDVRPVDAKMGPALGRITMFCGTHPLPSDANLAAAEAIVECLAGLTDHDVVIFVVSGGGSTLLFLPAPAADAALGDRREESLREEVAIFNALTAAGATIQEMNVVRKHLSLARGGQLAKAAYPARVVSLIFSDVPGDEISSIASGPTVKDETTIEDVEKVLAKYDILRVCNIEKCDLIETPKEDKYFKRATNILAVSNRRALEGMKRSAEGLGFSAEIRDVTLVGEASAVATMVAEAIHAAPAKSVLLWGGETTVTMRGGSNGGGGQGGRNLTVSATALDFVGEGEEILSLASDGHDHGAYAGAICDIITKDAAIRAGADVEKYLADNNTYPLFEKIGNYLMTGDTGSNVSDLIIALKTNKE